MHSSVGALLAEKHEPMNSYWTKAAALCFLSLSSQLGFTFPIEPVTLRSLIERSDLIVWATVEAPPQDPNKTKLILSFFGESPARLRTTSLVKGALPSGLIKVYFDPNLICPAPPRFPPGSNVLAFLYQDQKSGELHTVALDYGAKILSSEDAKAYITHIQAYLTTTQNVVGRDKALRITEWLVKCVEDPVTRWEGAAELAERSAILRQTRQSEFAPLLTVPQIARLSNVLFRAEYITSGELPLITLFRTRAKAQTIVCIDAYLRKAAQKHTATNGWSALADHDDFPEPWNIFDVMWEAADLVDSDDARAILKKSVVTDFFKVSHRMAAVPEFLAVFDAAASKLGYVQRSQQQR